jgi:ADP-sugar diphosphatase
VEFKFFILSDILPDFDTPVTVTLARDLNPKFNKELLGTWEPFVELVQHLKTSLDLQTEEEENPEKRHPFHDDPYELKSIHIQAVDFFGERIGFLKYTAIIQNKRGNKGEPMKLPG